MPSLLEYIEMSRKEPLDRLMDHARYGLDKFENCLPGEQEHYAMLHASALFVLDEQQQIRIGNDP